MKHYQRNFTRRLIDAVSTSGIKRGIGRSQRYLLTVAGRKTGTQRTTPVSLVIDGQARYLVAPYGEVAWVRNARSAGLVTLARAGRIEEFKLTPVDPAQGGRILSRYVKLEPVIDGVEGTFTKPALSDPAAVKFVGNVPAGKPSGGLLRHKGWRAGKIELPPLNARQDSSILAPAEIEVE